MTDHPTAPPLPVADGLLWRAWTGDDAERCQGLLERVWDHDGHEERPALDELLRAVAHLDLARDTLLGEDDGGEVRAVVRVAYREGDADLVKVTVRGAVDPDRRRRGIGRALLAWGFARADEVAGRLAEGRRELPVSVGFCTEDHVAPEVALARASGLEPTRWFTGMRRDVGAADLDTVVEVPDGLRLVRADQEDVTERLRLAHNEAFRDHWGSVEYSADDWRRELEGGAEYRPALSAAVLDTTAPGEPAVAYLIGSEYEQDWAHRGSSELYVDVLGTVRSARGRGLARLLLAWSARRAAEVGHAHVGLDVDTENPSGAYALYEALGFVRTHGETRWERA
ncbi:MAG: GNAT family N-acetyltransferase [Nocardioidaceae bacterium]|nr:GNAT family N-acetyltransferase [Nocardioidaceae bacterium]